MILSEDFLHFVWKMQLYNKQSFAVGNEKVEVLQPGIHNTDAGPDFLNAKIKIGNILWAGNIEIHRNSSDWTLHKHHRNKAYDSVILHVVLTIDCPIYRTNGEEIPAAELQIPDTIKQNYFRLRQSDLKIPCGGDFNESSPLLFVQMLDSLLIEKIESKTESIELILKKNINSWADAFYIFLARAFGTKINGLPFELMAKSLPLKTLAKHSGSLFQTEALLFGQAGMLAGDFEDEYFQRLKKEYNFLAKKFGLCPIEPSLWKLLRLRPQNFPAIRISQFADLIVKSKHLFSQIIEAQTTDEIRKIFGISASEYWETHYVFGKKSPKKKKGFGKMSSDNILINTVVPFLFIYGQHTGQEKYQTKAIKILESLPAENNSVLRTWETFGVQAKNAAESQALLHLKKMYCDAKRCTACKAGSKFIISSFST